MFKVLIWDYTGISSEWCKKFLDMTDVEIVHTITPAETAPEILLRTDAWDWLLIFEQGARNFFDAAIQLLKLPPDRVIYAFDIGSWLQHPKATYTILNDVDGVVRKHLLLNELRMLNIFATCTVEGMSYVSPSADMRVPHMFISGSNWASRDMKRFHALAKQYYGIDDGAGYFLDLGANIGTTGIYFLKKLTPNLKLLAFEPDPQTCKMHRINVLLNDMENAATVVNCGLGNAASELTFYRHISNSGANSFIEGAGMKPIGTVKIVALDSYLAENNIAAQEVKYIWIDTEGFEAQVLLGAKNLLAENPAPIFMECNLTAWEKSGLFEDMMSLLATRYTHFIMFSGGNETANRNETLYPLDALRTIERPKNALGQVGDIFLIKAGSVSD